MNIPPLISRSPPPLDDDNNDDEDDDDEFTNVDPLDGVILDQDSTKPAFVYINSKHITLPENVESSNVFESQLLKKCDHSNPPKDNLHSDNSINHFSEESKSSVISDASVFASACAEVNEFSDWFSETNYKSDLVETKADKFSADQCKNGSTDSIDSCSSAPPASETNPQNLPTVINLKDVPQCTDNSQNCPDVKSDSKDNPLELEDYSTSVKSAPEDIAFEDFPVTVTSSPEVDNDVVSPPDRVNSPENLILQVNISKDKSPDSPSDIQILSSELCSDFTDGIECTSDLTSLANCTGDVPESNSNLKSEQTNLIEEISIDKLSETRLFGENECDSQLNIDGSFQGQDLECIIHEDENYCKLENVDNELKISVQEQVQPDCDSDNDSFDEFVSFHPVAPGSIGNIPSSAHSVSEASTSFGSAEPAPSNDFGDFSHEFDDFSEFASFDAAPVAIGSDSEAPGSKKVETWFNAPEEPSSDVSTKDVLPMCLTEVLKSNNIWLGLSNFDSTPALKFKWTASVANRKLLGALRIDSRNILAAPWNRSIPIKGSSSDDVKYSGSENENSLNVLENKTVPQPHFDWVGSGLVNPLDGGGNSNLLDVQLLSFALTSSKSTSKLSFNQKAQCLQAKGSIVSFEATSFLQTLPDLSYMHQRCIVFPKKV